jgi:hypothetical protein
MHENASEGLLVRVEPLQRAREVCEMMIGGGAGHRRRPPAGCRSRLRGGDRDRVSREGDEG